MNANSWKVDGAGPLQVSKVKTATKSVTRYECTVKEIREKHPADGGGTYTMIRTTLRFGVPVPDDDPAKVALRQVGEKYNWTITRDNAKHITADLVAAASEVYNHLPCEDKTGAAAD